MKKFCLFICFSLTVVGVFAQQRTVSGTVRSAVDGTTLPGVTVVVKGVEGIGTVTDMDGRYQIGVPANAESLVFSYVGMESKTVPVSGASVLDVELDMATSALEEVVVTALGISRESRALGFSTQELGDKDLSATRDLSVSNYLTGKVAGVQVSKTAGGTGSSTNVVIRGVSSISGNNQPLWVIDGVPMNNFTNGDRQSSVASADIDYGDGIGDLNPQDVESMTVLKGPAATALYGSRGANGVILITTKSGKKTTGIEVEVNSGVTFEQLNLLPRYQNKFAPGYGDDDYAKYTWMNYEDEDGNLYPYPENGFLDSWGGPLDGKIMIPNWFALPKDGSIPQSVWDIEATELVPLSPQPKDNVRKFFETGITLSNNVSLTASDTKSSMRLSLGDITATGIVPNHEVKKRSITFSGSTNVSDRLSFDARVNYIRTEGEQRPATGFSSHNPFFTLTSMARITPLDFIKYQYEVTKVNIRYPGVDYNPYFVVNEVRNNDFRDRVLGAVSSTLKINDWLNLTGRVGVDFYSEIRENRWPTDPESKNTASRLGQMIQHSRRAFDVNGDVMLSATRQLTTGISLNAVAGASIRKFRSDNMSWDARDFKAEGVYHISNFNDIRPSASLYEKEMQSVFATAQFGYKNMLFLDLTGRNDWSSALGVNNQSFFYPSASASFVFTDAFDLGSNVLNYGKVRASWAQVGNDSDPYMTRSSYSLGTTGFNGLPFMTKSGVLPLYDLKNELTESIEFGLDLRLLDNRVRLDLTYYNAVTSNQILTLPVSVASGYSSAVINAGEIKNAGIEIALGVTPVYTSNFSWTVDANWARNTSEVVVLDGNIETYRLIQNQSDAAMADIHAQIGAPYGNIIGYAYKRAPDGRKIVGANGKYLRESEVSVLGNITPDWIGGLNNTFTYKRLSMNVLLDFVQGGDIVSATKYHMTRKGTGAWTVEGRRPKARYEEGDVIPDGSAVGDPMPYVGILPGVVEVKDGSGEVIGYEENTRAVQGQDYWASRAWDGIAEEFVEDGSYIALREIMLTYRLQPSLLAKTPLKSVTVSLFGRNLGYLQNKMDYLGLSPESAPNTSGAASGIEALAVPSTRTYGANLRITF